MNLATFLPEEIGVGEIPEQVNTEHWGHYFEGLRARVSQSWEDAKRAYLTLQKIREDLGLPFVVGGEAEASGGALTTGQEQLFLDMQAVSQRLIKIADGVLGNRRTVGWVESANDLGIEVRSEDTTRVEVISGRATLVDISSGQVVPGSGTIGIHPVVWVGYGAVAVVAMATAYFIVADNNDTARVLAENKTLQTIANAEHAAVLKGATPEEAAKIGRGIHAGAVELKEAEAKVKVAGRSQIPSVLKTVGWLMVGAAGIYLVAKVAPAVIEAV